MAAPPPAKRQRKLVVLSSSSDNNEETETRPLAESADANALTYSRPVTTSSRENPISRSKTTNSNNSNETRARQQPQQQKAASISPKKGKKTRQDEPASRSLHNFFQPATDEQRWSFQKSDIASQQQQQPWKKQIQSRQQRAGSSFTDELEEDLIEDDFDFSDDVFDTLLVRGKEDLKQALKGKEEVSSSTSVARKPARASSKRFILDEQPHHHYVSNASTSTNATSQTDKAQEEMRRKPWSEQYPPANVEELAVHKKKVVDVQNWLSAALSGRSRNKLLVLHGPAGCGKTSTISLLSNVLNFDIVEWKSPFGADTGNGQYTSLSAQFDDFLSQLNGFGGLDLSDSTVPGSSNMAAAKQTLQKRVILIEEFPASLSRGSIALSSFQTSLRRYLASSSSSSRNLFRNSSLSDDTPPIIIIISETTLGTSGAISDNLTANRLLGPELYTSPGTATIEFNSIAPTFMLKALQLVLKKEARHSMRQRIPGLGVLKRFSELGDIRSAISSLEFLCLRNDKSDGWGGRVAAKTKTSSRSEIPLTAMEKESLELITQRESSLGLFHAVGKVVYNKRDDTEPARQQEYEVHVAPPRHLKHLDRPKVSQVSVEDMMDKTGTDVHTFTAALHENYPPSCDGPAFMETLEACIENLSDSDILGSEGRSSLFNSRSGVGTARGRFLGYGASIDRLRQDEISFHVAVRGMLFSLPYPVRRKVDPRSGSSSRRVGGAFKMYYPTSQRLWKDIEEVEGLVSLWERQLLSDPSGIRSQKPSASGRDLGVASWKTANPLNSSLSSKNEQQSAESQPITMPFVMSREDLLLHYLPYLSRIIGGDGNNTASARGLDKITQFNGIDAPKEEELPDDDDIPAEAALSANDWSTDPVSQPAARGTGRVGFQNAKPEHDEVAEDAEEQLYLTEDDIED